MVRQVIAAPPVTPPHGAPTTRVPDWASLVRNPVLRVVARRCAMTVPLLFVVSALTFVLVYILGVFWLGEQGSLKAGLGVTLVLLGLLLISTA